MNSDKKRNSTEAYRITLKQLESYLWEAADILRGPVDASDFKTYIFPLLFFKRISDVYDEEFKEALDESGGDLEYASFAENHRFQIPDGHHWNDVRQRTTDVGQALTQALRSIEKANHTLYGIFGDAQWTNKDRFPDRLMLQLMEHFSKYNLSNSNVDPDIAGRAYEYLIKKFADLANKKAGEFYTPRSVVRLLTLFLDPGEKDTIYDPACGTGGMLLESVNQVKEKGGDIRTMKLYGQEKNLTTSAIARMNLILHGLEDFTVIRNDTLVNPSFFDRDKLSKFDCVIANPPFSLKNWGRGIWENDPFGRCFAGLPPKTNGDYAWVQHMISSMVRPHGRMAVVLPHGALFRMAAEGNIRKKLLEMDLLEGVIGLGPNLFYGTGLAACIMLFRASKPLERRKKIIFIDASNLFRKGRNQNTLLDEHADQIYDWYTAYEDVEGAVKVALLEEIEENEFNLNIPLYVEPIIEEEDISVEEALADLKTTISESFVAEERLKKLLIAEGLMQ